MTIVSISAHEKPDAESIMASSLQTRLSSGDGDKINFFELIYSGRSFLLNLQQLSPELNNRALIRLKLQSKHGLRQVTACRVLLLLLR